MSSRFERSTTLLEDWHKLLGAAVKEVFGMMAGIELSDPTSDPPAASEVAGMVGLAGDLCGVLTVRCSRASAKKLAGCMMGVTEQLAALHACDAVGEICNMVAGCFKAKIDGLEDKCMLSVPTVISGASFEFRSLDAGDKIDLSRTFQGESISFSLQVRL